MVNYIAPTRLAVGKASLDPLRSVQFRFNIRCDDGNNDYDFPPCACYECNQHPLLNRRGNF